MITVFIPTHNPNQHRLRATLDGLKNQSMPYSQWELLIVDNASTSQVLSELNLSWHPAARVVKETRLGLTWARMRGFTEAAGEIIVMVDDDNVLDRDYLANTAEVFRMHPKLGAIGGNSLPRFDVPPPDWVKNFWGSLALRELGSTPVISSFAAARARSEPVSYPDCAPIGAGMAIRKQALQPYIHKILHASESAIISDRKGNSLSSGGDNDIVLTILFAGWEVGYFPQLKLEHIIPEGRITREYLARMNHDSSQSWIALLHAHGICPWEKIGRWTVPFRKLKAYLSYRPWQSETAYIRWRGACGMFEGLANL